LSLEIVLGYKLSSYAPITMEQAIPKSKEQAKDFVAIVVGVGERFEVVKVNLTCWRKAFLLCGDLNKIEGKVDE